MNVPIHPECVVIATTSPAYEGTMPWPAPDPYDVLIEEKPNHYIIYRTMDSGAVDTYHAYSVEEALRTYQSVHRNRHYPLEGSWTEAVEALNALAAYAADIDQNWSRWPAYQVEQQARTLRMIHQVWMDRAEDDGRTW